jgi:Protein of unknown function (DUF1800)
VKTRDNIIKRPGKLFSYTSKYGICLLFLYLLCFCLSFSIVIAAPLSVTLADSLSGETIADSKITAYKKLSDGSLKWAKSATTDSSGQAHFDLDSLGSGVDYVFGVKAFNNIRSYSRVVRQTGQFEFLVGKLKVKVVDGNLFQLSDTKITVYENIQGKNKWVNSGYTDESGIIRFDLDGIGEGRHYFLKAKSPIDQSSKTSSELLKKGDMTFKLGNKALNVVLQNSLNQRPITDVKITAYERLTDGKLNWISSQTSNQQGNVVFDLDGLGEGRNYVLGAKIYNGLRSYSTLITQTGDFLFDVGRLEVSLINGADGSPLTDHKITVIELLANGDKQWIAVGLSDSEGFFRINLDGIGEGRSYILKAKSLIDGSSKYSQEIVENGKFTFTVGNSPLLVTLENGLSAVPVADIDVVVKERLEDGKLAWVQRQTTNSEGKIAFDLDGLGSGRTYVLSAKPYNGGTVYSEDLLDSGEFIFRVGTVPVSLIDRTTQQVLSNKKLTAYEKSPDGRLHWRKTGLTDEQGRVHFDLPGLKDGAMYVIKASNIFGQNHRYYSSWITQEGKVLMELSPDDKQNIDLKAPVLNIIQPEENAEISHMGFILKGNASDNQKISRITVFINDPIKGISEGVADYNEGYWQYKISANSLSPNQKVVFDVRAYDTSENMTQVQRSLNVIDDKQAPVVTITSHQENQQVSNNGFIVSGNVSDNTGIQQFTASVNGLSGLLIDKQMIQIAASGRWSFVIKNNLLNKVYSSNNLILTFSAADFASNQSDETIRLEAIDVSQSGLHPLNRITFGITPKLLEEVQLNGFKTYLQQQMSPVSIDDSELIAFFGDWLPESRRDLIDFQLYYATYSKRQLLEVMTWFWENHFNTDIRKTRRVSYEVNENKLFRQHALGSFKQLLTVSATSPAMMIYLDNYRSRKQQPNENYARELLELHTMGVDGGYSAEDISEIARVFTGWRVRDQLFYFDKNYHDDGAASVLGHEIPAGLGMDSGLMVVDILANHPSTAKFICKKLTRVFIADEPEDSIINSCSETFLQTQGDISQVLWTIFQSAEFNSNTAFHKKIKTPIEYIAGLMRNLSAVYSPRDSRSAISNMGMPLFQFPVPTGWSETGESWSNANQLLLRMRFNQEVAFNKARSSRTHLEDPVNFFKNSGYETVDGIVGYLFQLVMANDYSELEWQTAYTILAEQENVPFDLNAENVDSKLRTLIATLLSFPAYQLQ